MTKPTREAIARAIKFALSAYTSDNSKLMDCDLDDAAADILADLKREGFTISRLTALESAPAQAGGDVREFGDPVRLKDCPPGLFLWKGNLCFRSEYATMTETNPNQPDAYVVESGEYFWGGASTSKERDELLVQPAALTATPAQPTPGPRGSIDRATENTVVQCDGFNAPDCTRAVISEFLHQAESVGLSLAAPTPERELVEALCGVTEAIWFTLYCDYKEHGPLGETAAILAGHAWSSLPQAYRDAMPPLPKPGTRKEDVPHVSTCPPIDRAALTATPAQPTPERGEVDGLVAEIDALFERATQGRWEVQTGCSWSRIGAGGGDGNVLCPTNSRTDNHPDLTTGKGEDLYANLELICALVNNWPSIRTALADTGWRPSYEVLRTARDWLMAANPDVNTRGDREYALDGEGVAYILDELIRPGLRHFGAYDSAPLPPLTREEG